MYYLRESHLVGLTKNFLHKALGPHSSKARKTSDMQSREVPKRNAVSGWGFEDEVKRWFFSLKN